MFLVTVVNMGLCLCMLAIIESTIVESSIVEPSVVKATIIKAISKLSIGSGINQGYTSQKNNTENLHFFTWNNNKKTEFKLDNNCFGKDLLLKVLLKDALTCTGGNMCCVLWRVKRCFAWLCLVTIFSIFHLFRQKK